MTTHGHQEPAVDPTFPTPPDTLTGRWRITRAEKSTEEITIAGKAGVIWVLELSHAETDVPSGPLRCRALASTTYTVGQEVEGHIARDYDGEWFRRDSPVVSRRRR